MRYITAKVWPASMPEASYRTVRQVNLDEPLTGEQAGYTIYVDRVSQ